jgi:hypothetical protein
MKRNPLGRTVWLLFLLIAATLPRARGSGVVNTPDEAALRAALSGGGLVTFNCDGRIVLTNTLTITNDTTLDASGHAIILSGGGAVSVLLIQSPARFIVTNVTIADGAPGGIHNNSDATIIGCTFSNNAAFGSAANGGAIAHYGWKMLIVGSAFIGNFASIAGGGIYNGSDLTITNCTFSGNVASNSFTSFGGAIGHYGTNLVIVGSTFARNMAGTGGGALFCADQSFGVNAGPIAITNSTFFANGTRAVYIGGEMLKPVTLVNCSFAWNTNAAITHDTYGYPNAGSVYLLNNILAYTVGGLAANTEVVDLGYNICSDGSSGITNATSRANIDPLLGPLADNGGPTMTIGLLDGSPALDVLPPTKCPATDQRGVARPVGPQSDIGAFEGLVNSAGTSTFRFVTNNYSVNESEISANILVERTGTSRGSVSVGFTATNGTATAGLDFAATNLTLNFADGEMQKTVSMLIYDDKLVETNETVLLSLHDPVGAGLGAPNTATLTIIDNEQAQTLTNLDDASLRAALTNGGIIQFAVGGTVMLTNTLTVSAFAEIDANGHDVVLDGGGKFRILNVPFGASLTLKGLTLANGLAMGAAPAPGVVGNDGAGGAIEIDGGTVNLLDCEFLTNSASGSPGAAGNNSIQPTTGGAGKGGAIFNNSGVLLANDCTFAGNMAHGGVGGYNSGQLYNAGTGGPAQGGAVYNLNGLVALMTSSFVSNVASGGDGGNGTSPGYSVGGDSRGGCLFSTGGQILVQNSALRNNQSVSGSGKYYSTPGTPSGLASGGAVEMNGGTNVFLADFFSKNSSIAHFETTGQGGAISVAGGSLVVGETLMEENSAVGGAGTSLTFPPGYVGGSGLGGALFLGAGTAIITNSAVVNNIAQGGAQPYGNTPGSGSGGGLYNLSTNSLTNVTVAGNRAVAGDNSGTGLQGGAYGGGLYNAGGVLTLNQLTIAGNMIVPDAVKSNSGTGPLALGAGIYATNGTVGLLNTIVANNAGSTNLFGYVLDNRHNLSSDSSCRFTNTGSLNSTDPKLGVLDNYGGPTPTMPLLSGSPAIDGGDSVNFSQPLERPKSGLFC